MRIDYKQSRYLGIALIVLGVLAVLGLWGLLPTLVLGAAGVYLYTQRRQIGRIGEAVHGGLWLLGLALLFLVDFVFPGVLLLAGLSLLLRGREHEVDSRVQHFLTHFKSQQRTVNAPPRAQQAPVQSSPVAPTTPAENDEAASTGETIRL